jgi:hypothetical protein
MTMLSSQEEQREREETLRNDLDVKRQQAQREQSGTFFSHAEAAANDTAGGRFASVNVATVVGAEPAMKYPQLPSSSPWSGAQPEPGPEPPLGFENPALETSADFAFPAEKLGAPVAAAPSSEILPCPSSGGVETSAGAPSSSEQTNE